MTTIKGPGFRPVTTPDSTVQTTQQAKEVAKVTQTAPADQLSHDGPPAITDGTSNTAAPAPIERAVALGLITALQDHPAFEGDGPNAAKPGLPIDVPAGVDLANAALSHDDVQSMLADRDNPAITGDYKRALEQLLKEIDVQDLARGGR